MSNRKAIYYWKCDRPSAFRTLTNDGLSANDIQLIETTLKQQLQKKFGTQTIALEAGGGQGNHLTYLARLADATYFLRLENGPEGDDYMEVEARVLDRVRATGVPTPRVFAVDASRLEVPYSYQFLEYRNYPDLNHWHKAGKLDLPALAATIGKNVAKWQTILPDGFGPFDPGVLRRDNKLQGLHSTYPDYFFLNWEKHLHFLTENGILSPEETWQIQATVSENSHFLQLEQGCLVHKDLALWNILGEEDEIKAFIDWDDTISGDPTDDLSLLACFYAPDVLYAALRGYESYRPLPENFYPRFWLHLLRNMVVKAVIRVGGGYFKKKADFFLIGSGASGSSLEELTQRRIRAAWRGLQQKKECMDL